jgi:hypothetical protein
MLNKTKVEDSLLQLRDVTNRFQVLHELQVTQLRLWPYAVDPSIIENRAEVDFDAQKVYYYWALPKKPKIDRDYLKRLNALLDSVRFMLGKEWGVEIQNMFNKETIFSSEDVRPIPAPVSATAIRGRNRPSRRVANRKRKTRS